MRNLKKFLALVLAMMMVMSLMLTVNAAKTPAEFSDSSKVNSTYAEAVNVLSALGVVKGDDRGFRPQETITRAEVAAMLYRIAHNDADESQVAIYKDYGKFPDVPSDKWYAGAVNYCANSEYIKGYSDGTFGAWRDITGYEVLAMTLRVLGYGQNGEFEGSGWMVQTARYARVAGLTDRIKEGTLGAPATREMVAEIMFQALQATLVDYNMLLNYYPAIVLVEDTTANQTNYATAIAAGLKLPVNSNLMYENYKIVGKKALDVANDKDDFGRPMEAWVKDHADDTVADGEKFIVSGNETIADDAAITLPMTPVKVYDNAIDECHMTKDINNDNSIAWGAITEYLNGATVTKACEDAADTSGNITRAAGGWLDATHTTTKYIGATGRTTEIYKLDDTIYVDADGAADANQGSPDAASKAVNQWVFVYVDTFLGVVGTPTAAIKDTAGHIIKPATVTVSLGNGAGAATLTLDAEDGKYKGGELILVQTPNGTTAHAVVDFVENPELAPLTPADVPNATAEFPDDDTCVLYGDATKVENVTIQATVGAQDAKMGIIASDGTTYYASNTFLAARADTNHKTVVSDWYDGVDTTNGINNSMIGRTFNLVLDHHGYIIGMDEVTAASDSKVGIITGIDSKRIAAGKYVTTVEAFMDDNTTKTFDVVGFKTGKGLDDATDADLTYWASAGDADGAWIVGINAAGASTDSGDDKTGGYGNFVGLGSLVKFGEVTMSDGGRYWKIAEYDSTASVKMADGTRPENNVVSGRDAVANNLVTGQTASLLSAKDATNAARLLDDNSTIFVAEYEYRYNTNPGTNDGSNVNKTYKAYKGFKNIPTVVAKDGNLLYQQITGGVLVYATNAADEYIIKAQSKITVDDSYLVLSRGATYAEYSEYNVLKNGELTTLKVSNANAAVNAWIESTMDETTTAPAPDNANHYNELILVTGTNAKGYATSVSTVTESVSNTTIDDNVNSRPADFEIIKKDATALNETTEAVKAHKAGVLRVGGTDASGEFLTVDDNVIVKIVNRDLKTCYDSTMSEAMQYANGVDGKDAAGAVVKDGRLESHDLVFELNEYGYVCALYVID